MSWGVLGGKPPSLIILYDVLGGVGGCNPPPFVPGLSLGKGVLKGGKPFKVSLTSIFKVIHN